MARSGSKDPNEGPSRTEYDQTPRASRQRSKMARLQMREQLGRGVPDDADSAPEG